MPCGEGILLHLRAGQYSMYPTVGFPEPSTVVGTGTGVLKCPCLLMLVLR